jgi:exopolyphosphatase/guanosine-5'-triphosphate,3'-diphosphate pyrophosphatase
MRKGNIAVDNSMIKTVVDSKIMIPFFSLAWWEHSCRQVQSNFHRKKHFQKKDTNLVRLNKYVVKSIRVLSALLRIVEGLDRSHNGIVSNVRFYIASTDSLVLEIHVHRECQLEIWGVEKQKEYFKKMFGYSLQSKVIIE